MTIIDEIDAYGSGSDKIALIHRENILTYSELLEKSNALACYLINRFQSDKTPFIVYGHKQPDMMVAFLACVKSGHAYIPIDSTLPNERMRSIVESAGAKLILNIENRDFNFKDATNLTWEIINGIYAEYRGWVPDKSLQVQEDDVFYIIYTSGSTGIPKGVQITHSCLKSFIKWGLGFCTLSSDKEQVVFMNQAPFSFDLSVMDLYLSLISGSVLFCIDKDMIANIRELFFYLKKSGIRVWVSTPSFAEMCLADSNFSNKLLPEMKSMLFCGETLTNKCTEKLMERFDKISIFNMYGPTEATVAITAVLIDRRICREINPLPVGYVKEDCRILIMRDGKEVPEGEKGEIVIAGDSVSTGYYMNPEMTEKAFFGMVFDGVEKRSYKTGDEGYIKDGLLYYCGRMDFQIKLSGYRIEIEDIESNFRKLENVKNVAVLPIFKNGKVQYLAAFAVLTRPSGKSELAQVSAIKTNLKKLLPEYMIPRRIVVKENLPMTTNGKINRQLLLEELLNDSL